MDFSQVDTPFDNWARENNLQVFKMYKDYEVRSVDIVKSSQSKWQLWLEPKPELKNTLELIQKTILSKKGWKGGNTKKCITRLGVSFIQLLGVVNPVENKMQDSWQSGDPYEYYMGRWSKLVAEKFVDWLSPKSGLHWLDVGCGSGALSEAIVNRHNPVTVVAIDQSDGFVSTAAQRLGSKVSCKVGNAMSLPLDDATINVSVSGLVLNFIPDPEKALSEMYRVTKKGGTVAIYIWDYAGKMEFLTYFWDAAVELNPAASALHEGRRFPGSNAEQLIKTFSHAGISEIESTALEIVTHFTDFNDYWKPFLGGQGPAPSYVAKLDESERSRLRETLAQRLPVNEDGSILLSARAWATKGVV